MAPIPGDYPEFNPSSEESPVEKPSKWNQHYIKYINKLEAGLMRKNQK